MSTTPVTVGTDTMRVTSTGETAEAMIEALSPSEKKPDKPRVISTDGSKDKDEPEKDEHAVALGKKGGEAAAKAKKEAAKAKPATDEPGAKEAKGGDDKAKDEKAAKGKAEPETDPEAGEGKDKKGDPRLDAQARIAELAREKREAREEAARLRQELAEARRAPARTEAPPAAAERREAPAARTAPDDDPEPQEAEFENYADFVKASSRWAARDEHRKVEAKTHMEKAHREYVGAIQSDVDTFHERVTGLKKGDPKQESAFQEFMSSLPDELLAPPSIMVPAGQRRPVNLIADIAMLSPKPREIYEYFADNLDEYQRIAALRTRDEVIAEMAIVKHRLDAATSDTSARREPSRAGTPPRSVGGSANTGTGDEDSLPFSERVRRFGQRELQGSSR